MVQRMVEALQYSRPAIKTAHSLWVYETDRIEIKPDPGKQVW